MAGKLHSHRVSINDKRRQNKRKTDMIKNGGSKKDVQQVFDLYYRDQVRALYRAVTDPK